VAHVFFDLDGTLTDSADGITRCLAHAVQQLGVEPPARAQLVAFIGTPLQDIFRALLGTRDSGLLTRATALYVERFDRVGIRENRVFPGIEAGLARLRAEGHSLHVATAKAQPTAEAVIDLFELGQYFCAVHGTRAPRLGDKAAMLERVLMERTLDPADCIMVGDRRQDVAAAHYNGMKSVWVEWGYGTADERDTVRPHGAVSDVAELLQWIGADPVDLERGR